MVTRGYSRGTEGCAIKKKVGIMHASDGTPPHLHSLQPHSTKSTSLTSSNFCCYYLIFSTSFSCHFVNLFLVLVPLLTGHLFWTLLSILSTLWNVSTHCRRYSVPCFCLYSHDYVNYLLLEKNVARHRWYKRHSCPE